MSLEDPDRGPPSVILHADGSVERVGRPATEQEVAEAEEAVMRFVRALAIYTADRDFDDAVQRAKSSNLASEAAAPAAAAVTEHRIQAAFASTATLGAREAADLIGCDVKSLRTMTLDGTIGSVVVGSKTRRYREIDMRAYLTGPSKVPGMSAALRGSTTTMGFTEMMARKNRRLRPPKG